MATNSTERTRQQRARRRAGIELFTLKLPLAQLGETLVAAGWLDAADRDDLARLRGALEQALREWCGAGE